MMPHTDGYNREFSQEIRALLFLMTVFVLVVTAGLYLAGFGAQVLGFLVGSTASFVYLMLVSFRVFRSASLPRDKAVTYMRTGWLVRLSFIVMILIVSLKLPQVSFPAAVAGLLSLQIVLFFKGVVMVARHFLTK